MQIKFQPITKWPNAPTRQRQASRFDSSYDQTLFLLVRELEALSAKNIIVEMWISESMVRRDGYVYANARPTQPGVVLRFEGKHGAVQMPCDTFHHWQDNLRAIALSLEALRKVGRYGCSKKGEQYRGWTALHRHRMTSQPRKRLPISSRNIASIPRTPLCAS